MGSNGPRVTLTFTFRCAVLLYAVNTLARACPDEFPDCYDCSNPRKRSTRDTQEQQGSLVSIHCRDVWPCKCDDPPPVCPSGIGLVLDGCGCCHKCGRSHGDRCTTTARCDEANGLVCDWGPDIGYEQADEEQLTGVCKAKDGKKCRLSDSLVLEDGEKYERSCRELCTCQNGVVSCTSLCPQESQRPNCKNATLVSISNVCCKEWVCPEIRQRDSPAPATTRNPTRKARACNVKTSHWSQCSKSCDVGESYRVTNDNAECEERKEIRLCMLRPCGYQDVTTDGVCRPTTKVITKMHIKWNDCTSVFQWKPKFCSTCKNNRCCVPNQDKTKIIDFHCPAKNVTVTKNYMWIKNCKCHRKGNKKCGTYRTD